jgi:hypothetical protein
MFGTAAMKYGSEGALKALLNKRNPGFYENYAASPAGSRALSNYFAAVKNKDPYFASIWLREITQGNRAARSELLTQSGFLFGPQYMQDVERGNLQMISPSDAIQNQIGAQNSATNGAGLVNGITGDIPLSGNLMVPNGRRDRDTVAGQSYNLNSFDENMVGEYTAALHRQGVTAEDIPFVIAASRKQGFDPRLYGAILSQESAGGTLTGLSYGKNGVLGAWGQTGVQNPAQISRSSGLSAPTGPEDSINKGAFLIRERLNKPGATLRSVMKEYVGPDFDDAYYQRAVTNLTMGGVGVGGASVPNTLSSPAEVLQAGMAGAATSFEEMNKIVPTVNGALRELITAAHAAAQALERVGRTNSFVFGGT